MPGPYREVQDLYFHAGQDFVLNTRDVIGVFDLDTAGASRRTEEYFRHVESERAVGRKTHHAQQSGFDEPLLLGALERAGGENRHVGVAREHGRENVGDGEGEKVHAREELLVGEALFAQHEANGGIPVDRVREGCGGLLAAQVLKRPQIRAVATHDERGADRRDGRGRPIGLARRDGMRADVVENVEKTPGRADEKVGAFALDVVKEIVLRNLHDVHDVVGTQLFHLRHHGRDGGRGKARLRRRDDAEPDDGGRTRRGRDEGAEREGDCDGAKQRHGSNIQPVETL